MRNVTLKQYKKAKSIVNRYEIQKVKKLQRGRFGFLYWLQDNLKDRAKWIKAKNIESACKKFMRLAPQSLIQIDYEVSFGDGFIDISNVKSVKEFVG